MIEFKKGNARRERFGAHFLIGNRPTSDFQIGDARPKRCEAHVLFEN